MVLVVADSVKDYILKVVVDEFSIILTKFILIVDVELFLDKRYPLLINLTLLNKHLASTSIAHVIESLSDVQNLIEPPVQETQPQQKVSRTELQHYVWALRHGFVEDRANLGAEFLQVSSVPPPQNHFSLILDVVGVYAVGALSEPPGRFDSCSMSNLIPLEIVILPQA